MQFAAPKFVKRNLKMKFLPPLIFGLKIMWPFCVEAENFVECIFTPFALKKKQIRIAHT